MALDDVPLEDAGRDYYARQFDSRVRNLRKNGRAPARNSSGRGNGWAAGGGVVAVLIVIRIIVAIVFAVDGSNSSSYNNYSNYSPTTMPSNAPIDWNNNIQMEQQPWQIQPADIPEFDAREPRIFPDPPTIPDLNAPLIVPDDDPKRLDKDD